MKVRNCICMAVLLGVLGGGSGAWGAEKILIYSPWKDKVMRKFNELFEKKTGIKAESINVSTGEIYARLKVEKARPQADVWHSVRASILKKAEQEGLITTSRPKNLASIFPRYTYPGDDHLYGTTMYPLIFAYNRTMLQKMGVKPPRSYQDLLDPKWKDQIVMPHAAASGTGYAFVTTILQLYRAPGETGVKSEKGWDFLTRLNRNIAQYTRSGSAPSKLVAAGEFPVAITFYDRVYRLAKAGYPIVPVFPSPIYAEPSCTALVANSPNPKGAKKFLDFMLSKEAQILARTLGNYSVRTDLDPPAGAPALASLKVFDDDYVWGAKNKKKIVNHFNQNIIRAPKKKK